MPGRIKSRIAQDHCLVFAVIVASGSDIEIIFLRKSQDLISKFLRETGIKRFNALQAKRDQFLKALIHPVVKDQFIAASIGRVRQDRNAACANSFLAPLEGSWRAQRD